MSKVSLDIHILTWEPCGTRNVIYIYILYPLESHNSGKTNGPIIQLLKLYLQTMN